MAILKIKNLNFHFKKDHKIVSDFSFDFMDGEVVHILGHSGIGKSTLASLIAGHLRPISGMIHIDDTLIEGPSRKVIVVHQENDLFPWLTVRQHLEFLKDNDFQLKLEKDYDFKKELELFSLESSEDLYPHQISGGMKRRLAILRGLLLRPRVLILDESMSSIHTEMKVKIMRELKDYIVKNKMLLLIIDHNASDLKSYIDRTVEF